MPKRTRWLPPAIVLVLLVAAAVIEAVGGLAGNAASSAARWPGPLDIVRKHPFIALFLAAGVVAAYGFVDWFRHRDDPPPATAAEVAAGVDQIRQHIDRNNQVPDTQDERLGRFPPYAAALLRTAEHDLPAIWKIVEPFVDDANDPVALAREWASMPPNALHDLPALGHLVVAETLAAYGQPQAGIDQLLAAVHLGVAGRAVWLTRAALTAGGMDGETVPAIEQLLADAERIDSGYPVLRAAIATRDCRWSDVQASLATFSPTVVWERDSRATLLANAAFQEGRQDEAIDQLEAVAGETDSAGVLLSLAHLLRARSVQGGGDSRWKDAFRAGDLAVRARNLRRLWRGDSAEAVVAAAEAAILADSPASAWTVTRSTPDGDATPSESADARVLPLAALGAALTGRASEAQQLVSTAPPGYVRLRVEAEIVSTIARNDDHAAARTAWTDCYQAASTDDQKLQALRGLAMEGATDTSALAELRERHPAAVEDIETVFAVMSIDGADVDTQLRACESRTALASIRRAEILRINDPQAAADVLSDATERWHDPRLLLMAVDCYVDAGEWEKADPLAQRVIAESGTLWPGRTTVLRRMMRIQHGLQNWPRLITTCEALLELDQNDEDARWGLAYAQYRNGDPEKAWATLNRPHPISATQATADRAGFFLELARRYAAAEPLARKALQILDAFADDHDVHAAVILAITMRADQTVLPDDIGAQVTETWQSYIDRYPDSTTLERHTIREDDDNPLAEIEPLLRQQAEAYAETVKFIKEKVVPVGLLGRVVGKPYSAIFVYRPLGYHAANSVGEQDVAIEGGMAQLATSTPCFVDASALYTLTLVGAHVIPQW